MRILYFVLASAVTVGLIIALNTRFGKAPAFGVFLSPQHGFWQNAEPFDYNFNENIRLPELNSTVNVYFDERLVPHIYSDNQLDAVFVQGYLHARFRLWQMEFQTHAAAGRISEVIGDVALNYDREQRRLGMVYAAENMLAVMEADPLTKSLCDAYTSGVNAYIERLSASELPLEYKILGYQPEKWNNLKIALFVKAMNKTLAGNVDDLAFTAAQSLFTDEQMKVLFPAVPDSLQPIIPKGTPFVKPGIIPVPPATADSLYFARKEAISVVEIDKPNRDNGSNNWVVSGKKTRSGAPILANDPHLELSLPAIWYEMQLSGPDINVYGTSFPGIPGIVIGFNDSIAWGVTNSQRDVRDYYEVRFKDASKKQYWFNNEWQDTRLRIETIHIKDNPVFYDTVAYTVFGPVMYDSSFMNDATKGRAIAVRWKAHDASNEAKAFWLLNHARNYQDYEQAISYFECPAQNFVFASKSGDIAIWQQGTFPARWDRQGLYVMPGADSSYMWQGYIPREENPHSLNPEQGFLQSANQRPVDGTYPYFIPGGYDLYRGITIHRKLTEMNNITVDDLKNLHNENYNAFAATARPLLLNYVNKAQLSNEAAAYLEMMRRWDLQNNYDEKGPTIFSLWYDSLENLVWNDELGNLKQLGLFPSERTLTEAVLRDTAFVYIDNVTTPGKETWSQLVTQALEGVVPALLDLEKQDKLKWGRFKNTTVYHLLKTALLPFARTGLPVGGGAHIVNATQHSHGPSWRMVVELTDETEAFVVYPGGQSGNPGSRYYDQFVDTWARGDYYRAWVYKKGQEEHPRKRWKMTFSKA
ncbi:MAG TPA: penicillin acylase family protein [Lacibacter sp.]|nr:penicillin acylase family protein [Lacibacter sp.]